MDLIRAFMDNEEKYDINIQGTQENPLFQANQIGELLGIKKIRTTLSTFDDDEKVYAHTMGAINRNQNTIFLTEFGLYRMLCISRKPIAKKFQKMVFTVLKEIKLNGMYILEEKLKENEINIKLLQDKNDNDLHNVLLNSYNNKRVIYFAKLKEQNIIHNIDKNYNLYKIGKTDELKARIHGLYTDFSTLVLVNVFECNNNSKLERYLHNHEDIKCHFKEVLPNKKETYLLNDEQLNKIVNIINHNLYKFKEMTDENRIEMKRLEIEEKKLEIEEKRLDIIKSGVDLNKLTEIIEKVNVPLQEEKTDYLETPNNIEKPDYRFRIIKNTNSPKIQKYNADTLEYIETFDSVINTVRSFPSNSSFNAGSLKKSIKNNTIYFGFRWLYLDRDKEDIPYELEPTKIIRTQVKGDYIAKLNINKTTIEKVYGSQKEASLDYKVSIGTITSAIKRNNRSNGGYWYYWNDIPQDIRDDYTNYNKLPERLYLSTSIKVQKINPETKQIVKIYNSIQEVQKTYQFSRLSLKNASKEGTIVKNFLWKILEAENT